MIDLDTDVPLAVRNVFLQRPVVGVEIISHLF